MNKILSIIFVGLYSFTVAAQGLSGEQYLNDWVGQYEVVSCESCPDLTFENGIKFKDIKEFYIGSYTVPSNELPQCAQTDNDIFIGYMLESSSGTLETSFFSPMGICYWDNTKSLTMSETEFEYSYNRGSKNRYTKITQIGQNSYEVIQKVEEKNPSFGYPEKFELKLIIQKL